MGNSKNKIQNSTEIQRQKDYLVNVLGVSGKEANSLVEEYTKKNLKKHSMVNSKKRIV